MEIPQENLQESITDTVDVEVPSKKKKKKKDKSLVEGDAILETTANTSTIEEETVKLKMFLIILQRKRKNEKVI